MKNLAFRSPIGLEQEITNRHFELGQPSDTRLQDEEIWSQSSQGLFETLSLKGTVEALKLLLPDNDLKLRNQRVI